MGKDKKTLKKPKQIKSNTDATNDDILTLLMDDNSFTPDHVKLYNLAKNEYPSLNVEDPYYIRDHYELVNQKLNGCKHYLDKYVNPDDVTDDVLILIKNNSYIKYLESMISLFKHDK